MKQYELAVGLRQEGDVPGAYRTMFRALEIDDTNAKAHLMLANMYLLDRDSAGKEHDGAAEQHYKRAIELEAGREREPNQVHVDPNENIRNDALNGLAVLYIHQGRHQEAIELLKPVASDIGNPLAYMAWGNLGWAYLELEDYTQAEEVLTRSVRLQGQFCVGYLRLGKVFLRTDQHVKAEQSLTAAIESHRRCGTLQEAWQLRGEARLNMGNRDDARSDFERCVELSDRTPQGASCRRYLEATY